MGNDLCLNIYRLFMLLLQRIAVKKDRFSLEEKFI